jgi:ubiquinone/menaquinone biosynthesis C-methylase UbiE
MAEVHDRLRDFWNRDSETYDLAPGHAMTDPVETAAWRSVLTETLPPAPARVLDAGAGTGALALLAAELGHQVTALDLSEGMLAKAQEKAAERGLEISFVVGPADAPPPGPFDAIIERHVLWTTPDPFAALRAWREVARPGGRLVLCETVFGRDDAISRARRRAAEEVKRVLGVTDSHHAPYPEEVLASLPFSRMTSPSPVVAAVYQAGWRAARIARLRDVEWARRLQTSWPLGWLEHVPRFAVTADA